MRPRDPRCHSERTLLETTEPWSPDLDVGTDVAVVFGHDATLAARLASWRDAGYVVHFAIGASWGSFTDYLYGGWDGEEHTREIQTDEYGARILRSEGVPYLCPTETLARYLAEKAWEAVRLGACAVHLHEPESWVRGGWCEAFREAWGREYGQPWVAPNSSTDARYRASKLMHTLQARHVRQILTELARRRDESGLEVRLHVGSHSLLNHAQWRLVSPQTALASIEECDGCVGQAWSGSARTPVPFRGQSRVRPFEAALLEYSAFEGFARATGQRMWLLSDPTEDDPARPWRDCLTAWRDSLIAALLATDSWRYEPAPWPERILRGHRPRAAGEPMGPMPADDASVWLTVTNALHEMRHEAVRREDAGPRFGVLVSDTVMYQRGEPAASDPDLGFLYGPALALLTMGLAVEPVSLELLGRPGALERFEVLFLTYEGQKPPSAEVHARLREWTHAGGVLVYMGDDRDAYHGVLEWWNRDPWRCANPREHLFEALGLHPDVHRGDWPIAHRLRTGGVVALARDPSMIAASPDGPEVFRQLARAACRRRNYRFEGSPALLARRGPYVVVAGVLESGAGEPLRLEGAYVDLLTPDARIREGVEVGPGDRMLLLDLGAYEGPSDRVLCAAGRVHEQRREGSRFTFLVAGPEGTTGSARVRLSAKPSDIALPGCTGAHEARWHAASRTLLLRWPNRADGQRVRIGLA